MLTVAPSSSSVRTSYATVPIIDIFMFNDEVDMLLYRLQLHGPYVSTFVVVESSMTHAGKQKPLLASRAVHELQHRYDVQIESVPFTITEQRRGTPFERENAQRRFILDLVRTRFPRHMVYVSDVDELLDFPSLLVSGAMLRSACVRPLLRVYYYGEHCPMKTDGDWAPALVFRTDSNWFTYAAKRHTALRNVGGCNSTIPQFAGWHFSFASNTTGILNKLTDFCHAKDSFVRAIVDRVDARRIVEDRVCRCRDLFDRNRRHTSSVPIDGKMPPVPGWPRHPLNGAGLGWVKDPRCAAVEYTGGVHIE